MLKQIANEVGWASSGFGHERVGFACGGSLVVERIALHCHKLSHVWRNKYAVLFVCQHHEIAIFFQVRKHTALFLLPAHFACEKRCQSVVVLEKAYLFAVGFHEIGVKVVRFTFL